MRSPLLISIAALAAPMMVSAQAVVELDRVPRGYNRHPVTTAATARCATGRDRSSDLNRLPSRTDPIPNYGWLWVTVDAIRDLAWPRAAGRVDRMLWDAILTPKQRDSIRAFEGTPVVVDGYLLVDHSRRRPIVASEAVKASRGCEQVNYQFWLTADRDESRTNAVPITMTPQMRQRGWTLAKLDEIARNGQMVRVWGWLLFDPEYAQQEFVALGRSKAQGTPWTLQPIVEIEVFQRKHTLIPLRDWD
jgi:hypothetical protein